LLRASWHSQFFIIVAIYRHLLRISAFERRYLKVVRFHHGAAFLIGFAVGFGVVTAYYAAWLSHCEYLHTIDIDQWYDVPSILGMFGDFVVGDDEDEMWSDRNELIFWNAVFWLGMRLLWIIEINWARKRHRSARPAQEKSPELSFKTKV
jgi:hypothetical protein